MIVSSLTFNCNMVSMLWLQVEVETPQSQVQSKVARKSDEGTTNDRDIKEYTDNIVISIVCLMIMQSYSRA
jgi:hypothetical protein